jgi:hypothetical protein
MVLNVDSRFIQCVQRQIKEFSSSGQGKHMYGFCLENSEMVELLSLVDSVDSFDEAKIILEGIEDHEICLNEWLVSFDYIEDLWVFRKAMPVSKLREEALRAGVSARTIITEKIDSLEPREFEAFLVRLFRDLPHFSNPEMRKESHDGGYEFRVYSTGFFDADKEAFFVQAKHQKGSISVSQVRELIGTLDVESRKVDCVCKGLMISNRPPSKSARESALKSNYSIVFLSTSNLVNLMIKHHIGLDPVNLTVPMLDRSFW